MMDEPSSSVLRVLHRLSPGFAQSISTGTFFGKSLRISLFRLSKDSSVQLYYDFGIETPDALLNRYLIQRNG
jgi:hypothetical protein